VNLLASVDARTGRRVRRPARRLCTGAIHARGGRRWAPLPSCRAA